MMEDLHCKTCNTILEILEDGDYGWCEQCHMSWNLFQKENNKGAFMNEEKSETVYEKLKKYLNEEEINKFACNPYNIYSLGEKTTMNVFSIIEGAFSWAESTEGCAYWVDILKRINEKETRKKFCEDFFEKVKGKTIYWGEKDDTCIIKVVPVSLDNDHFIDKNNSNWDICNGFEPNELGNCWNFCKEEAVVDKVTKYKQEVKELWEESLTLWQWLAATGKKKSQYPLYCQIRNYYNDCPLCLIYTDGNLCEKACPLAENKNAWQLCHPIYYKWSEAEPESVLRKQYAFFIYQTILLAYNKKFEKE